MIRRKKMTVFLDAKETTSVIDLKRMIAGITKTLPENQRLFKDDEVMDDRKSLTDYNLNPTTAKAQSPATIGLSFRDENGRFETLEITSLSTPPELPDVMKSPETQCQTHDQSVN
ncbi:unnamed protein product [Oppiella nova]|uniref:Ubiquitin-like domain-containing protein n=1 Tax=Oppiella nova TaxID=334625 RepID=A0A7R9M5Z4_9ACAR|nr:unnamed protein product [Oppiella nova]CAD7664019.1 unnamed protein product [Oppiella nova]CAG2171388.1 unnamed protein product [Oppiella nova]CAG2181156.1 unnamed protein product [Oppiella nova]